MLKGFDKYDLYSIVTLIVSALACAYLIYRGIHLSKPNDDILTLIISVISSVVSIGGLIIAVLQIFKVSTNTKTYKDAYDKTIEAVINNESISLLSRSLQQLTIIKHLFESETETSTRSYFNNLLLDLILLKTNKKISIEDKEKLTTYINYCIEMDTLVYKDLIKAITDIDYSIKYETLTELQSLLTSLQQKLNTPIT